MNYTGTPDSGYGLAIPFFPSHSKKKANNYLLAKKYMDYIDGACNVSEEERCRIQENMDLYSGRWPALEGMSSGYSMKFGNEDVALGGAKLRHYPIIERVAKAMVADLITGPLNPTIKDHSSFARTNREKAQLDRVKQYLTRKIIVPSRNRIAVQVMQEMGIQDNISAPIEVQATMEDEINKRLEGTLDEDLKNFMESYRTPSETVARQVMDFLMRNQRVEEKFTDGAKYAVAVAEEYYRLNVTSKLPRFDVLNPSGVSWHGGESVEFVEEADYAKYEEYITPMQFISRHGIDLTNRDYKNIEENFSEIPSHEKGKDTVDPVHGDVLDKISKHGYEQVIGMTGIDMKSIEGRNWMANLYKNHNATSKTHGICSTYITWKWTRKIKKVVRNIDGCKRTFLRDEHYRKNPLRGDISVENFVIPQVWHGYKYGQKNDWYVGVEPVPYQYQSIDNPTDVKLTIYGTEYRTPHCTSKKASHIDLGKPWQYKMDCLMSKMEELEKTDIGKVLVTTMDAKPKNWTWKEWFTSIFAAKIVPVQKEAAQNNYDNQLFRSVDLSRNPETAAIIQKLGYFKNELIEAMRYSPGKMGQISQYATNQIAQANISGVDRQNFEFAEKRRNMKERVLNGLLHLGMTALRKNEDLQELVLDDIARAHFKVNMDFLDRASLQVTVEDNAEEYRDVQEQKQLALTYLQNKMSAVDVAKIHSAKSKAEIIEITEQAERRFQKQQAIEHQRLMESKQLDAQVAEKQLRVTLEAQSAERMKDREFELAEKEIIASQFERANDVDGNKIPDSVQAAIINAQAKERVAIINNNAKKEAESND